MPRSTTDTGDRISEEVTFRVNIGFLLGSQRISEQDFEFAVHQLVESAVRALSPSRNDPFMAVRYVD